MHRQGSIAISGAIDANGAITLIAGTGIQGYGGDGAAAELDRVAAFAPCRSQSRAQASAERLKLPKPHRAWPTNAFAARDSARH